MKDKIIVEKKLGITGDYQFKALRSRNFLQANWHRNKLLAIGKLINSYKPKRVLDLGAGSGNFEIAFYKKVKKITALDYNQEAMSFLAGQLGKKNITNIDLVNEDILNVSRIKKLGKFDLIILIDVLEHLPFKSAEGLITGLKDMLAMGGKVVVITPNYQSLWPLIEKLIDSFTNIPHLENMQHITKYYPKKITRFFQGHGYKAIYFTTFNNFAFLFPGRRLSSLICELELRVAFTYGNLMECVFELPDSI